MIQNILTNIGGVSVYGIISICLFAAVFLALLVWAFSRSRNYLQSMSALPLDGGERERGDSINQQSTSEKS